MVKVVVIGNADDGPVWRPHIRNFRIVIVRDICMTDWFRRALSAHDVMRTNPCRATASFRPSPWLNRVFRDKPGGLLMDYLGLADQLKHALANYSESGGKGDPTYDTKQAIADLLRPFTATPSES